MDVVRSLLQSGADCNVKIQVGLQVHGTDKDILEMDAIL